MTSATIRQAAPVMGYTEGGLRRACKAGSIPGAALTINEETGRAEWRIPAETVEGHRNPGQGRPVVESEGEGA